jgi:hypothetical protein
MHRNELAVSFDFSYAAKYLHLNKRTIYCDVKGWYECGDLSNFIPKEIIMREWILFSFFIAHCFYNVRLLL